MDLIIGSCQIVLYLPNAVSLKEKRQILKSLKDRLRNRFNIAVAETKDNDLWQRATLGIAYVSNDRKTAVRLLDQVIDFLQQEREIKIIDYEIEV